MNKLRKFVVTIFIGSLITSCGNVSPMSTVAATEIISPTITTISPTFTLLPVPSVTAEPLVTETALPISSSPYRLCMAYVIDGNLYFQEDNNLPEQLTFGSEEKISFPVFSDDSEKIIFYRGLVPHKLYSINTDGTEDKILVTGALLGSLSSGYDKFTEIISLAYVPDTHLVLFNTRQLSQQAFDQKDFNRTDSKENQDLISVNTDTGELKILREKGAGGDFFISPDGNMVAILANGHIDVINIDGQIIHRNLADYFVTHPYELSPNVFWNADSTELTVTFPKRDVFDLSGPETLLVGQYSLEGNENVVMDFDPPVLDGEYDVSLDGTWILYFYYYYPGKTDETIPAGIYLGNLQTGESELYSTYVGPPIWSADSRHFVFDNLFLGVVDGLPISLGIVGFVGWGDADHFLYRSTKGIVLIGEVSGESTPFAVDIPESANLGGYGLFTFNFQVR